MKNEATLKTAARSVSKTTGRFSKSNSNGMKSQDRDSAQGRTLRSRRTALEFIPLGGLGEIGKNMYAMRYGDDIIVIDCGLMFPDEDMLGIDFVIPDTTYLDEHKDKIRGIVVTHGHEDHIGALPFVLPKYDVPLYATRLTLGLVEHKMSEATPRYKPKLMELSAGGSVKLGCFTVRFIAMCHSIPDAVAVAVETPLGTVIHTGDFKLDPTPVDGRATDYATLAEMGRKGVLLLSSDSTNVERAGFTPSEQTLVPSLCRLMRDYATKRIVISSFASNLNRVQLVLDAAAQFGRHVAFAGRSMVNNVEMATKLGYLKAEPGVVIPLQDLGRYEPHNLIVMTTGSQGEPFSGLVMMSKGQHHKVKLNQGDVVALFATPIPGNERTVSRTIDQLFHLGCHVLYEREEQLHVSGHASREELKIMLNLTKPKYFVPVHGEYRMQVRHGRLAEETGVDPKNIFLMNNGDVLSITSAGASCDTKVPAGAVMVDGLALGEKESSLVGERRELSENGVLVVSMVLNHSGQLVEDPQFESYGQIHLDHAASIRQEFVDAVRRTVKRCSNDEALLKRQVTLRCRELLKRYIHSSSCVIPLVSRSGK